MSRKRHARHQAKNHAIRQHTVDGYENLTARLGIRAPNLSSDGTYFPSFTSRNRTLVEFTYRSSWLIGAAVDTIADDMTKKRCQHHLAGRASGKRPTGRALGIVVAQRYPQVVAALWRSNQCHSD